MAESTHTASSRKPALDDDTWNEIVNEWINTSLRNTVMSGNTEAWNHLMTVALPELRKIIDQKI